MLQKVLLGTIVKVAAVTQEIASVVGPHIHPGGMTLKGVETSSMFKTVKQGQALLVTGSGERPRVVYTRGWVWPWEKSELVDMTLKTVHKAINALLLDNRRAVIKMSFFMKILDLDDQLIQVARSVGAAATFSSATVENLFADKFEEAVLAVARHYNSDNITKRRENFRDQVIEVVGKELGGYHLEDAAVQEILPSDRQELALGGRKLLVDWIELKKRTRLGSLLAEHRFAAMAHRLTDESVVLAPKSDTVLAPGEQLAVAGDPQQVESLIAALLKT